MYQRKIGNYTVQLTWGAEGAMNRISACLLLLVMGCSSCGVRAQGSQEPLRETQLLALVAGAALPENIVEAIRDRGVSFASDADFRAKLEAVGTDPRILEALDAAKVIVPEGAKEVPNKEAQKRIVEMATQYKSEKFPDDPRNLLAVIKDALGNPESGFVMGQMLRRIKSDGGNIGRAFGEHGAAAA